ncbi:prephenate dehydrogenase/arogenate dehydrogenase family protein [Alkalibaculum sp. M08DMB]|uniref:Prephenate dehydrogenase/arogenate dehydrogenase family protein n=1 Tax=Alkalibaculum sporogenes TaxID=2655001 RepID=A0A6A7K7D3_9FIRM|nr:prephenate dehydrogenase [Alkalibaculum sporogenes]MPW25285.1 prephenate dehydrogenase/arogenate dehydrogenase family protein [Alkalibaculum sporogenes]
MDNSDFKGKNILIVGLGLMGCSFADAFRDLYPQKIYGFDINKEITNYAQQKGLIDEGLTKINSAILGECDFVMICLYLDDAVQFICKNMDGFKKGCIITDIVGVKRKIVSSVQEVLRDDIDYIPGHPMAGKERQGFGYADKKIFKGKNYILTPTKFNKSDNVDYLEKIIKAIGFENVVYTDPEKHDEKIAFTSQLCHVIASSMVDINVDDDISNYEGGSFQDMTRIAMINSKMWSELFIANKDKLVNVLDNFLTSIESFKMLIEKEDPKLIDKLDIIKKSRESL